MDDNATFVKAMKELEQCDFIRKFTVIGKTYNAASLLFLSVVFAIKIAYKHQPKEVWRGSI